MLVLKRPCMDSECAESLWGGWFGHSVYEGWLGQDADGETNGFAPENWWLEDEISFWGPAHLQVLWLLVSGRVSLPPPKKIGEGFIFRIDGPGTFFFWEMLFGEVSNVPRESQWLKMYIVPFEIVLFRGHVSFQGVIVFFLQHFGYLGSNIFVRNCWHLSSSTILDLRFCLLIYSCFIGLRFVLLGFLLDIYTHIEFYRQVCNHLSVI